MASLVSSLGRTLLICVMSLTMLPMQAGVLCAILSLSQEKAFDRVDLGFMRDTLSTMGCGPSFISCIDLFYRSSQSAVNVNGHIFPIFLCHVGLVKAVLCRPFSTLWWLKS